MTLVPALTRKLLRDLWVARGQVASIAAVMAAALAGLLALAGTHRALTESRALYYDVTAFPHLFAHLGRAPLALVRRVEELPGVASAEARLLEPATVVVPGVTEPASGVALSLPGGRHPSLRGVVLQRGRNVEPAATDECLALDAFALAHDLDPGDTLLVTLGGRQRRLRMVGTVLSPEYLFSMGAGGMLPDDRRFTALFLGAEALGGALGARGTFDDLTVRLEPGASVAGVKADVDRLLAPHGGRGAVRREDHPSHRFVSDELTQLEGMATRIPFLFLGVAAFLVHVVLSRMVATQLGQIATLRALGYGRWAIGRHFLGFGLVTALLGTGLGLGLGLWLGQGFCRLYGRFFRFPVLEFRLAPDLILLGVGAAVGSALFGCALAVRAGLRLAPAEAMRPPAPPGYRRGVLTRLGLLRLVSPAARITVRELERRPWRTGLSVLGLAVSTGLIIVGQFSRDTMDHLVDVYFHAAQRADVTVALATPGPPSVLGSFRVLPGVHAVEGQRSVGLRVHSGHQHRDIGVTGLPEGGHLRRVLDQHGLPIEVPREGLLLTRVTAERLGIHAGDRIEVERLDGDRRATTVTVAALTDELVGRTGTMNARALSRLLGEEPSYSAVLLEVDPLEIGPLLERLARMPGVAGVSQSRTMIDAFYRTSGDSTAAFTLLVLAFGAVIAVGVVYNNARVTLGERARELATLRVLGFTADEVSSAILGEMALHLVVGVPLGLWLGRVMAEGIMSTVDPELYRLPVLVTPGTDALAALVVCGAAAATALSMARQVRHLDPVSALEARD